MTRQTKNMFTRIALTLTSVLKTTMKPLSPSSKTPPSLKRTAAQPSIKDTAENPFFETNFPPGTIFYPLPDIPLEKSAPSEHQRLSAPGKTILCSGRFEMNDHGEILLDPGSGENPDWFFWSSGPNAMVQLDSLSVSSGVLYFTKADPNEPSHTPGVFQLSGISDPCLSLPITDILDKALLDYLKPQCLKANVSGSPSPVPNNKTPTPKENPMNELAEIREKIELVNLEIKALERLFQIVSTRVRSLKDGTDVTDPEKPARECHGA